MQKQLLNSGDVRDRHLKEHLRLEIQTPFKTPRDVMLYALVAEVRGLRQRVAALEEKIASTKKEKTDGT